MKLSPSSLIVVLLIVLSPSFIQAQNTWVGGFEGAESEWNQPENWSEGEVPGLEDHVRIGNVETGSGVYPVINTVIPPVATLLIQDGANLEITTAGVLVIDNPPGSAYGIFLAGELTNAGNIMITANANIPVNGNTANLKNEGMIAFIGSFTGTEVAGN